MIGYTLIGTNDYDKALGFYDALLENFGGKRVMETANGQLYGFAQGPLLGVCKPYDGQPATNGNGTMVALNAGSPEKVDAVYAKALELGASDEGKPGARGPAGFYGSYFRDPDGNKICAYSMG